MAVLAEDESTVTFRESGGRVVVLPKNPEKTVVCLNSLLDLWYMAGGKAIARVHGEVNVPEEALGLVDLGSFNSIDREKILELEPDLVIFSAGQRRECDFFRAEGIPSVSINYSNYKDFPVILDLFTRLTGSREIYDEEYKSQQEQIQSIIDQVPEGKRPSYVILFASPGYVKVETDNTVAGYNLMLLGGRNICQERVTEGAARVDLSLEYIVMQDPDVIFVTTMGDVDKSLARMQEDLESSDVWGDLTAIKEGRFHVLDKSYSIYKPNRFYPEAFKLEAEYLYPQVDFTLTEGEANGR
ncbi:MAG: ABC transporter substrate-binding protein [Spirochaetales bacterium]|nr:ABC transporter substrate-binding protein [Spirochaetales bacterium]